MKSVSKRDFLKTLAFVAAVMFLAMFGAGALADGNMQNISVKVDGVIKADVSLGGMWKFTLTQPADHVADGQDLTTLLTGKADRAREDKFLCHFPHTKHGQPPYTTLVLGDWKVIYLYVSDEKYKRYQLFNLKDDPSESHDLAKSHPEKLQTMMKALVREFKDSNAMLPVERKTEEILNISLPD